MVWQKNLRESLGIVAAIFLDESPGGSWRSCQDSLEFFCFIYVKSTLFSCVCQSHFRRPQGYFSCKLSRKTFFFLSKLIRPHKTGTSCIFRPSESKETVGVSPPSREKQVQVHGRESTGVLFWKEMAKERFAKRSSACHLFRLESFSFAHGVISIDEDLVGTVLNPVQHSIC